MRDEVLLKALKELREAWEEYGHCECFHEPCAMRAAIDKFEQLLSENVTKSADGSGFSPNPSAPAPVEAGDNKALEET